MESFSIGGLIFLGLAILGLLLFIVGLIFLIKNIKWKGEKDRQGKPSTGNLVGIVLFSFMLFLGVMWFICFGSASIGFFMISQVG